MRHLQKLEILRRRLAIVREEIVHILLETLVVELSPLLDFARHLFLHRGDILGCAVRFFKRFPRVEEGDSLIQKEKLANGDKG